MADKFWRITKIKPSPHSVEARLPQVYKNYLKELEKPAAPVHYIHETEKYKLDPETKQKIRVENRPLPLKFPKQADEGIWGGEGVVLGFLKIKLKRKPYPNYWVPKLKQTIVYSEILNKYMKVTVTERTIRLIDQHYGFDNYILSTPVQDLKSQLALSIRRKMLLALVNGEKYHENEEKNQEVFEKYKKFMIPKEEAEWFGLTKREAIQKQKLLEVETNKPIPLKHHLRMKYFQELKEMKENSEVEKTSTWNTFSNWLSKLNPIKES